MISKKTNKKFSLLIIILAILLGTLFCLIYFSKAPEIETEAPLAEEDETDIIKRITVPVDLNVEVESLSEETLKRITVPVDPNVEVESLPEETLKRITIPK